MTDSKDLSEFRRDYETQGIRKVDMDASPFVQFGRWLHQAQELDVIDATAMTLATASNTGMPSVRVVLLKNYDKDGFSWYTDSRSQKGRELAENSQAALLFHWSDFSRQIRIQGKVEQLSAENAEQYFNRRPEGSRFSAASSHQSSNIESRAVLEAEVVRLRARYPDGNVPRPEAWIGYRLKPQYFEFWQGMSNRLHDRLVYRPSADGWDLQRISP